MGKVIKINGVDFSSIALSNSLEVVNGYLCYPDGSSIFYSQNSSTRAYAKIEVPNGASTIRINIKSGYTTSGFMFCDTNYSNEEILNTPKAMLGKDTPWAWNSGTYTSNPLPSGTKYLYINLKNSTDTAMTDAEAKSVIESYSFSFDSIMGYYIYKTSACVYALIHDMPTTRACAKLAIPNGKTKISVNVKDGYRVSGFVHSSQNYTFRELLTDATTMLGEDSPWVWNSGTYTSNTLTSGTTEVYINLSKVGDATFTSEEMLTIIESYSFE